jgi:hypothetical protein
MIILIKMEDIFQAKKMTEKQDGVRKMYGSPASILKLIKT